MSPRHQAVHIVSTREELDAASSSVYTCVVGNAEKPTSSRYWTSIEYANDSDDEGYVRVLPGRDVPKFDREQLKLLKQIGEGGQGTIYTAQLTRYNRDTDVFMSNEEMVVAKLYKGRCGLWPEDVFSLHQLNPFLCRFHGYCLEGESLYLIMAEYDGSLRDFLDNLMEGTVEGRPLNDLSTLLLIIQIALGMCFLHENNIIHRDLKADNVFVSIGDSVVRIGDFDVASRVVGTLFWRAPEVLQALKEGKRPFFTPKADVYSFAMTCYEILTGGVPLEGVRASDYDAILQHHMRPKLPSKLNPKVKNLIRRCWHQDPEARPTFKEILVELKELHRKLITGSEEVSKAIDDIYSIGSSCVDIVGASPEASLWKLKALVEAVLVKYGKEDFVLVCMEMVADLEQYQSKFGFRSFEEHPKLPLAEWLAREKLYDKCLWKAQVFTKIHANVFEVLRIEHLLTSITLAIVKNHSSSGVQFGSENILSSYDLKAWVEEHEAWKEEYCARVLPNPNRSCACKGVPMERQDVTYAR